MRHSLSVPSHFYPICYIIVCECVTPDYFQLVLHTGTEKVHGYFRVLQNYGVLCV